MKATIVRIRRGAFSISKPFNRHGNGVVELRITIASTEMLTLRATLAPSTSPSSAVNGRTAAARRKGISMVMRPSTYQGFSRDAAASPTRIAARAPNAAQAPSGSVTATRTSPIRPTNLALGSRRWTGESPAATASTAPRPPVWWCPPPTPSLRPVSGRSRRRAARQAQQQDETGTDCERREHADQAGEPGHLVAEQNPGSDPQDGLPFLLEEAGFFV